MIEESEPFCEKPIVRWPQREKIGDFWWRGGRWWTNRKETMMIVCGVSCEADLAETSESINLFIWTTAYLVLN